MSWRKEKEKGGLEVGRVKVVSGGGWEVGVWGGKKLGKRGGGGLSNPTTSFQRKLSDKLGHADT